MQLPIRMQFFACLPVLLLTAYLSCSLSAVAQEKVFITEFMADNNGVLLDENNAASDWIEILNAGTNTVNLDGWFLTDDSSHLTKWAFPSTNLPAGSYLIVFASGKDRTTPGMPLHTSFELSSDGEYLALVKPDGTSIAHHYAPHYPDQVSGISYGIELNLNLTTFFTNRAPAKWLIPNGPGAYPANWMATNFSHDAWNDGLTGLGFDSNSSNVVFGSTVSNLALNKPANQSSTNSYGAERAVNGNLSDFTHTLAGANLPATWEVNLGTNCGIQEIILWNRPGFGSRLRDITVRVFAADGSTTYTSPLLNPENVLGGGEVNVGPTNISLNLTQLTGGLVIGSRVHVTRTPDPDLSGTGGNGTTSERDVLSLAEVEVFARSYSVVASGPFAGLINTGIGAAMTNVSASALIRVPFVIPEEELPLMDRLLLRMKNDDGFVAWLNGVEVARRRAPASLAWNSAATSERPNSQAAQCEDIDISAFMPMLQEGDNVVAIQGLNLSATDADFLVLPELVGQRIEPLPDRYFAQPTPGALNSAPYAGAVADTKFSVDRGFFDVPFTVAITTATANAEIRFTTNGTAPSAVSGTLYSGPITIDRTTTLRAIATKPGFKPSDVDTHTYIFLSEVLTQSLESAVNAGFPSTWAGTTPDYAMDPNVTGPYAAEMEASLRSLPSVFITSSISNLFDATTGIYTHPLQSGVAWERPISIEMVGTNGQTEFQENAGLRIQGGIFFRNFSFTQKKSLRVLFKSIYGAGRLEHDLFDEPGAVKSFDGFVLRAGANDGYAWSGAGTTVQFLRDEFGRRLHLDMGHPSARGMFVHVYLNGLYWGMYNLVERPNEDFSASYLSGEPEQWDACSAGDFKSGGTAAQSRWSTFVNQTAAVNTYAGYQAVQGNNPDGSRNPALPVYYDKLNYMDYMIANMWGGNWDWPNKNFWFGRKQTADSTGYKFYMWDFENTMGNSRDRSPLTMVSPRPEVAAQWVGLPHYYMRDYSEYQIDFADRVQRHFYNGGVLTVESLTNRYRQLADHVQLAIISESARWGDDNRTPAYGLTEWLVERDWILNTYLPQRSGIVLQQFRSSVLFPSVGAPGFSQFGGAVPAGFSLAITHTNLSGTIFFTTDGSDPRTPGTGAVGAAAQTYETPVLINTPTIVRARVLSGATWSPVTEAVFHPPQDLSKLTLTEIMYQPPNIGVTNSDEFEFLELKNYGTNTLNLSGLTFSTGITFTFTNGTLLAPGQFFVLVRNSAAFTSKYPGVMPRGVYSGRLDNGGEAVTLSHPFGGTVFSVTYDDLAPWPVAPDSFGFSLVPVNPGLSQAPDKGSAWRSSALPGGSPGADDPAAAIPAVVISEILAHTDPPQKDAVELYNPTDDTANLSGWYLTDDPAVPQKFQIPNGTMLPGGSRIFFDADDFNPAPGSPTGFALSSIGDTVYLFSATNGTLTGYSHGVSFGASFNGVSFGRVVNSAADENFALMKSVTLGLPNSAPRIGPVVINEIHYNPEPGGYEFVELLNTSNGPVRLSHLSFPTNTWAVNGFGFVTPQGVILNPGEMMVITATNAAAFRARYSVPQSVPVFGPTTGTLQNSGELLELQAPDTPNTNEVPYVTLEAVRYNDKSPWPAAADGTGLSLQRIQPASFANEPMNWSAAAPTPGQPTGTSDTDGDGLTDDWELLNGTQLNVPDADDDLDGDGLTNYEEFLTGTAANDPNSVFKFLSVARQGNSLALEFLAIANRSYSVLVQTNLGGPWSKHSDIPAFGTNRIERITPSILGSGTRFYRLVSPAVP